MRSDDSSGELLALVFLEKADRSRGEKKANFKNELVAPLLYGHVIEGMQEEAM